MKFITIYNYVTFHLMYDDLLGMVLNIRNIGFPYTLYI